MGANGVVSRASAALVKLQVRLAPGLIALSSFS